VEEGSVVDGPHLYMSKKTRICRRARSIQVWAISWRDLLFSLSQFLICEMSDATVIRIFKISQLYFLPDQVMNFVLIQPLAYSNIFEVTSRNILPRWWMDHTYNTWQAGELSVEIARSSRARAMLIKTTFFSLQSLNRSNCCHLLSSKFQPSRRALFCTEPGRGFWSRLFKTWYLSNIFVATS
jgi:hypothetical protein